MSFRTSLIILNLAALLVIVVAIVWRVFSLKRNPQRHDPQNLTPFFPDEDLEGRRLERALGWSLLFVLVIAIALPVYFIVEPTRESAAKDAFLNESIERGAVLFSFSTGPKYNSTRSLQCARCHGDDGGGGTAPFTLQPEADLCLEKQNQGQADIPLCLPKQVSWTAPALNTVLLRFNRGQVKHIITYGRPGTPMPPWGVASGKGVLNQQGIDDIVNYLASIQKTPAQTKSDSTKAIAAFRKSAADGVKEQEATLAEDQKAVDDAQAGVAEAEASGDAAKTAQANATLTSAQVELTKQQAVVLSVRAWNDQVEQMSEGAVLFALNCARCHTKNWSFFDPTKLDQPRPAPMGSGAYGPSLTGGAVELQFPGEAGKQEQFNWVAVGVPANNLYGVRGISTGSMPHFSRSLSESQINEIIDYERGL